MLSKAVHIVVIILLILDYILEVTVYHLHLIELFIVWLLGN